LDNFKNFKLPQTVEKALAALNFQTPTPIQEQAIPVALEGRDVVGCAQTGTGKTAAFCIPILTRLLAHPGKIALVLVPTRELAQQVDLFWQQLSRGSQGMHSTLIIGGMPMFKQKKSLARRPRLIVATPGRLIDHLDQRTVRLDQVETLVLDEADRMLDMGFAPQLARIMKLMPRERQTLFFTATWAPELDRLAKSWLRDPVRVSAGTVSSAAPEVTQALIATTPQAKNSALLDELNRSEGQILVFARTKSRTDRVTRYLSEFGVSVNRLHGGRTQGQRNAAMSEFRAGRIRVLVATDIAARGIDVSTIAHVVNYDLPQSSEDYIHRIGRTGRAGAKGRAVSLITPEDRAQWGEIARLLKKTGSQIPAITPQTKGPLTMERLMKNQPRRGARYA
jgi:superfamily II DNA/RNA helicase